MNDREYTDGQYPRGREALLVFLVVFLGGLIIIAGADQLLNLGPTLNNILFVALPLLAAAAAAGRLRHGEMG